MMFHVKHQLGVELVYIVETPIYQLFMGVESIKRKLYHPWIVEKESDLARVLQCLNHI